MQDLQPLRLARISTQDFPEHKRLATWREVYGRGVTNVDIEPIGDAPFRAEMTFRLLPHVTIAAGSRSPSRYVVTRESAGRGGDAILFGILRSGVATTTQFGKEFDCGIGGASLLTSADPFTATLHSDGSFITLALSRQAVASLVPDFSSAFGRPISNENVALRLLIRYLDMVQAGSELESREIANSASTHIVDLVALALGARGDAAEIAKGRGARVARLNVIRSDILTKLGRSDLSMEAIAAGHGISSRYVRMLFEEDGSSFSSFVMSERLARAQRMLVDRRYAHLNIAQVAHESGFGDISNFNRAFRRHFNAAPSDFRESARRKWRE